MVRSAERKHVYLFRAQKFISHSSRELKEALYRNAGGAGKGTHGSRRVTSQILCDSSSLRSLEKSAGSWCFMGTESPYYEMEGVLGMDGDDGFTAVGMRLRPLNGAR